MSAVRNSSPVATRDAGVSGRVLVVFGLIIGVCVAVTATAVRSSGTTSSNADLAARRARVAAMSPEQRERLERNYEAFTAMSEEEQKRLRALAAEIEKEHLGGEMNTYYEWLKKQKPSDRVALQTSQSKERIERIRSLREVAANEARWSLSAEDRKNVSDWLLEMGLTYETELIEEIRRPLFGGLTRGAFTAEQQKEEAARLEGIQKFAEAVRKMPLNKRRPALATAAWLQWRFLGFRGGIPGPAIEVLREMVSEDAQRRLDETAYNEQNLVGWWISQVDAPGYTRDQLDTYLMTKVSEEMRLQYLTMPADQRYQLLATLMFYKETFPMLPAPPFLDRMSGGGFGGRPGPNFGGQRSGSAGERPSTAD